MNTSHMVFVQRRDQTVSVKPRVHDSIFVPLAKLSMLLAGNYRCITDDGMRTACEAVHSGLVESRAAARPRGEYDDPLFGRTQVRIDGRATHPIYLAEVKRPAESKGPYDYYKILATIPPEKSARSLAESKAAGCQLVE